MNSDCGLYWCVYGMYLLTLLPGHKFPQPCLFYNPSQLWGWRARRSAIFQPSGPEMLWPFPRDRTLWWPSGTSTKGHRIKYSCQTNKLSSIGPHTRSRSQVKCKLKFVNNSRGEGNGCAGYAAADPLWGFTIYVFNARWVGGQKYGKFVNVHSIKIVNGGT